MYKMVVKHDPYLNIYVDAYILMTDAHCAMIDSGLYGQRALVEDCMRGRETALLCTHGHWDHIGMHKTVQALGGKVLAHPGDSAYLEDHDWHWQCLFGQFERDFDMPEARRETYRARVGQPVAPEYALDDGAVLACGDMTFSVIGIPGHSRGSVAFLERQTGALFTGDGLIGNGFFHGTPQYMDFRRYVASMEKLKRIDCETVYADHDPPLPGRLLAAKAQEGIDCALRIDAVVRRHVRAHANQSDLSLRDIIREIGEAEGRVVGAGTCVTALSHLEAIENPPDCVAGCLNRYIHGI